MMKIRIRVSIAVPNERVREFELEFGGPEIYIGRDRESDIHIPIAEVSRRHARIVREGSLWSVEDLGSACGTRVGEKILESGDKCILSDGDSIRLQSATLTVYVSNLDVIENTSDEKTALFAKKIVGDGIDNARHDLPYLLVMNGHREGLRAPVVMDSGTFVIGRQPDSNLFLDETDVSRKHATLTREWQDYLIEDNGSKNGVVVNGRRIRALTRLKNGDEIFLGSLHLCFIDPTANMIERLEEAELASPAPEVKKDAVPTKSNEPVTSQPKRKKKLLSRFAIVAGIGIAEIGLAAFACVIVAGLILALGNFFR